MARRVQLPQSKLKRKKRIRRARLAIVLGVLFLMLVGVVIGLSWLPAIRISSVAVSGTQTLSVDAISQVAQNDIAGRMLLVLPKNNILLYPKKKIEHDLISQYPVLKSVSVSAKNFQTLAIAVAERQPAAKWCPGTPDAVGGEGHDCLLMDANGFAYGPTTGIGEDALITYFGPLATSSAPQLYVGAGQYAALAALAVALDKNEPQTSVSSVYVDENADVHLQFADGFTLLFTLTDASADVFQRFTLALASQPFLNKTIDDFQYLDLRFGDKLYYKLKGQ